jgi:multidrug resistance efflux pump
MRILKYFGGIMIALVAIVSGLFLLYRHQGEARNKPGRDATGTTRAVKVVRPSRNSAGKVEVRQLCAVESQHKAELNTRIAGIVHTVAKDIGDRVSKGELLLELETPELWAEIEAREQSVVVKDAELRASKAALGRVQSGIRAASGRISQAEAYVKQAEAMLDYRSRRLERYNNLARQDTVTADLVDEQIREHKAAGAAVEASRASLDQAHGLMDEKEAEIVSAKTDLELKTATAELARKEVGKAKAQMELGRITAPFDGVLARRLVDPGDFVSAPSGVSHDPMLVIISDKLRVVANFPDNLAGTIRPGIPIRLTLDCMPGTIWTGGITRSAPMVSTADRTVRVEVDIAEENVSSQAANKLLMSARAISSIVPGCSGEMRLEVGHSGDIPSIPSSAIVNRGGQPVVLLVTNGLVRIKLVKVVVNDGKTALVRIREGTAEKPAYRELTVDDLIAVARQSELTEGETVTPVEESR